MLLRSPNLEKALACANLALQPIKRGEYRGLMTCEVAQGSKLQPTSWAWCLLSRNSTGRSFRISLSLALPTLRQRNSLLQIPLGASPIPISPHPSRTMVFLFFYFYFYCNQCWSPLPRQSFFVFLLHLIIDLWKSPGMCFSLQKCSNPRRSISHFCADVLRFDW